MTTEQQHPCVGDRYQTKGGIYKVQEVMEHTLLLELDPPEGKGTFYIDLHRFLMMSERIL